MANSKKTIHKHFTLHSARDAEMLEHLKQQENISKYVKRLILSDMARQQNEQAKNNENKRSEIRKEIDQYARTKMFREVIIEGLKDYNVVRFFEEHFMKMIEKNLEKYIDNRIKKALENEKKKKNT